MKSPNPGLATILVVAAIGCRNSKPTTPVPDSTTAVAAAQPLTAAPTIAEAPKANDVGTVTSVQVTPPASVAVVGENGPAEFIVQGHKGQLLRVQVGGDGLDPRSPAATMKVTGPGSPAAIKSLLPEFCFYESLYPLGEDGAFNVSLDPGGQKQFRLDFTLLSHPDALVDPGLRPEQVSLQQGVFEAQPYDLDCEMGESWPASLRMIGNKFRVQITQVKGYDKVYPGNKDMQALISVLRPDVKVPDARNLPFKNSGDAATVMTARPELIKGDGWKAWRWIEGASQDGDYPGGISYVAEGLTDDLKYFFRVSGEIRHPALKSLSPQNSAHSDETGSRLRLEKTLAVADPTSFEPNLHELDASLGSLKIRQ